MQDQEIVLSWNDKPVLRTGRFGSKLAWKRGVTEGKLAEREAAETWRQYFVRAMVTIKGIEIREHDFHAS